MANCVSAASTLCLPETVRLLEFPKAWMCLLCIRETVTQASCGSRVPATRANAPIGVDVFSRVRTKYINIKISLRSNPFCILFVYILSTGCGEILAPPGIWIVMLRSVRKQSLGKSLPLLVRSYHRSCWCLVWHVWKVMLCGLGFFFGRPGGGYRAGIDSFNRHKKIHPQRGQSCLQSLES